MPRLNPAQKAALAAADAELNNAGLPLASVMLGALERIAGSDKFKGGTWVKELQAIARAATEGR